MESSRTRLFSLAKKLNNFYFTEYLSGSCLPFLCESVQVGLVSREVVTQLRRFPGVFTITPASVTFADSLQSPDSRSRALEAMLQQLRSEDVLPVLRGWRDECYVSRAASSGPDLFKMDRSASKLFGVRQYGVHITGYVRHSQLGLCVWFQRRSDTKQTWPGMWDSFVGGGITEGFTVLETVVKEAGEEANVPRELADKLRPAGSVSFMHGTPGGGICPDTEYVFDLELPESFIPTNNDGEVADWRLVPVTDIPDLICGDNYKTTSTSVILDWMIRHSVLTPETCDNFAEIVELIHLPVHQLYNMK